MSKFTLAALTAGVFALFAGQAMAADAAPKTRAEVKAEAASAVKSGEAAHGEMPKVKTAEGKKSSTTRAARKAAAASAVKAGQAAEGEQAKAPAAADDKKSTTTRAARKAAAASAVKSGEVKTGEAPKQ